MTAAEYDRAVINGRQWAERVTADPGEVDAIVLDALPGEQGKGVEALFPHAVRCWRRELLRMNAATATQEKGFQSLLKRHAFFGVLSDGRLRRSLMDRTPWEDRRRLYAEFASLTADHRPWSLTHPFDELDEDGERAAVAAARRVRQVGMAELSAKERQALLAGGAVELLAAALQDGRLPDPLAVVQYPPRPRRPAGLLQERPGRIGVGGIRPGGFPGGAFRAAPGANAAALIAQAKAAYAAGDLGSALRYLQFAGGAAGAAREGKRIRGDVAFVMAIIMTRRADPLGLQQSANAEQYWREGGMNAAARAKRKKELRADFPDPDRPAGGHP
jgi:hypothetical protein